MQHKRTDTLFYTSLFLCLKMLEMMGEYETNTIENKKAKLSNVFLWQIRIVDRYFGVVFSVKHDT